MARNLRLQTRWILESNCGENSAEFRRIRPSDIPLYQCLGEGTIKKSIDFNGSTENIELLLQMVISVNQPSLLRSSGLIADLPVGQRALWKPVASGQLDKQENLTQRPLAEMQVNEERQGNLYNQS